MKYIKLFEDNRDKNIYLRDENQKSPEGYKYNLGDYVTIKTISSSFQKGYGLGPRIIYSWRHAGFDEESICVVCVVCLDPERPYRYVVVPIEATDSSLEEWFKEDELSPAPEEKVAAKKYNL